MGDNRFTSEISLEYRFADFEIDVARHELRRGGTLVPIEPQVFDLLVLLVRNRHRIVSKSELVDVVWQGRIVSDATLSARICAARRAVGDNGDDQLFIRTHHKRGFRFVGTVDDSCAPAASLARTSGQRERTAACGTATAPAIVHSGKPAITVLPFRNMSGDREQQCLANGLTEDIITGLSCQRRFHVVACNSSFAFRDKAIDIREVANDLGVQYILEGSVRKAADRIRVTAQLVDAGSRIHVWADRYDSAFTNIFSGQDEITSRIIDSASSRIIIAEAARLRCRPPENMDASDLVVKALPHMWRMTADEQLLAQELLQRAVALDPKYAHAHALLGWTYMSMFNLDSQAPIGELTEKALDAGARAVALDDEGHWGHLVLGLGYARRRRPDAALMHLSRSVALIPNFALGHAGLGYALSCGGQPQRGLEALELAQRLSPLGPFLAAYAPVVRYMTMFALEDYEQTLAVCRSLAARYPNHAGARRLMTVSLGLLGKIDEAKESLVQTLALQPDLSSAHVENDTVYINASDRSRFLRGLQNAGLAH